MAQVLNNITKGGSTTRGDNHRRRGSADHGGSQKDTIARLCDYLLHVFFHFSAFGNRQRFASQCGLLNVMPSRTITTMMLALSASPRMVVTRLAMSRIITSGLKNRRKNWTTPAPWVALASSLAPALFRRRR